MPAMPSPIRSLFIWPPSLDECSDDAEGSYSIEIRGFVKAA
jgi:hypothetical protein